MRAAWPESEDFSDAKRKCFIEIGQWIILVISIISFGGEVCPTYFFIKLITKYFER